MKPKKILSYLLAIMLCLQICIPVVSADGLQSYSQDFTDGLVGGWHVAKGNGTVVVENGALKAITTGSTILADSSAPTLTNGEYEVKVKFNAAPSQFGLVYRYVDSNNYSIIQMDSNSWGWDLFVNGTETYGTIAANPVTFAANQVYTFKIQYVEDQVQLFIDGVRIFNTSLPNIPIQAGKIGFRSWYTAKTFFIDDVTLNEIAVTPVETFPITNTTTISSDELSVVVDTEFPRIKKYTWLDNNSEINGQVNGVNEVRINGNPYIVTAASTAYNDKIAYSMNIDEIEVQLNAEISVEDNIVTFEITNILENGSELVNSIEFPNQDFVSVLATESVAKQAAVHIPGSWNNISEEFKDLKAGAANFIGNRTYAFLNNEHLAASVDTNVVEGENQVRVRIADEGSTKKATISSGAWTYRGYEGFDPEPLPWAKVVITPDINNDSIVDWQDGAIAYREIMEVPYGSEMIKDHISYISMNIGSTTTSPFLRSFDNAKKLHNLTDGFGQLVLHKGYQAEGHDDSHPDYGGHIGIRQGGVEDFNYMLSEGKKYNILGGVHINATEYMRDALEYVPENMTNGAGWGWLDQSYYVDKTKDVKSGELERRLDMLKTDTGDNLSFIYVDVYSGSDYNAKKLAQYVNKNDWMLGTEFAGPLYEQAAWVHWGTDPGYPNQGNSSDIVRFIRNETLDGFLSVPLLKGNQQVGVGYWQQSEYFSSYNAATAAFFNHNLPTKYMQHFPIMKMTDDRIDFTNNVVVERKSDGKIHLSKDSKTIAIMTDSSSITNSVVFIPWDPATEDKIYHWNPTGGTTTWSVPNSWASITSAEYYKLTDLGRELVGTVAIENGQVTLTAQQGVGYALYPVGVPKSEPAGNWGEGGHIKDIGFDSQSFTDWQKSSSDSSTSHITIAKNNRADDQLKVTGPSEATITQTITDLEPGKTYSASVWVNIANTRDVTLSVEQGNHVDSNSLSHTNHPYYGQQHKYFTMPFQRIKVNFDAEGTTAQFKLHVGEGNSTVFFDDVRVWENPNKTDQGNYVLVEDFENVDEGWGPFVYSKSGPVRTHLVEDRGQYFTYVLDGSFSLKTNEEGTGEWLRTLPHTLKLATDHNYQLKLDYNSAETGMYSVAIRAKENGITRDLAIEELKEGVNQLTLDFNTAGAEEAYLAIIKNFNNNAKVLTGELIVDNITVEDLGEIQPEEGVLVESIIASPSELNLFKGQTQQASVVVLPANAFDRSITWTSDDSTVATVDSNGLITTRGIGSTTIRATANDESNISATIAIQVTETNIEIPQFEMRGTASGSHPGEGPDKALDGNVSTMWHTPWGTPQLPAHITVDLGDEYVINQFNYTPRVGAGNGTITGYNLYTSTDGVNFTLIKSGTWPLNDAVKKVYFNSVAAKYVKLEAVQALRDFASAAEIQVFRVQTEVEPEPELFSTTLNGPSSVVRNNNFETKLGYINIANPIMAQDITIQYDKNVLQFVNVENILNEMSIYTSHNEEEGTVRIIAASLGLNNQVSDDSNIFDLVFIAKNVITGTMIRVVQAIVSDAFGEETEAELSSHALIITNPVSSGDLNNDERITIGDLAIVAAHYGKNSQSPDWNAAQVADVNNDGKIDLEDLVFVAKAIVN